LRNPGRRFIVAIPSLRFLIATQTVPARSCWRARPGSGSRRCGSRGSRTPVRAASVSSTLGRQKPSRALRGGARYRRPHPGEHPRPGR